MKKEEVLKKLFDCASSYRDNLVNNNLLFICTNSALKVSLLQTVFSPGNYLHMTGIKFIKTKKISPNEFYDKCINKRLSPKEFDLSDDGTTELKLEILPYLVAPGLSAKMAGDFSGVRPFLYTEKLVGGVRGGIGLIFDDKRGYYVPNTVINDDIRILTNEKLRIIATFKKGIHETDYKECVYKAKNVDWKKIKLPTEFEILKEYLK